MQLFIYYLYLSFNKLLCCTWIWPHPSLCQSHLVEIFKRNYNTHIHTHTQAHTHIFPLRPWHPPPAILFPQIPCICIFLNCLLALCSNSSATHFSTPRTKASTHHFPEAVLLPNGEQPPAIFISSGFPLTLDTVCHWPVFFFLPEASPVCLGSLLVHFSSSLWWFSLPLPVHLMHTIPRTQL